MNRRQSEKVKIGVSTFIIGSAVGSALAFLFAPKKGEELRKEIKDGVNTTVHQVRDRSGKIIEYSVKTSDDIIARAKKIINRSSQHTGEGADLSAGISQKLSKEAGAVKAGINAGIENYRKERNDSGSSQIEGKGALDHNAGNVFLINEDQKYKDLEDKNLPKHEGMGRRDLS